ncbi:hypothetical protein B0H11DRAFT_2061095 [Mycena galericulata]|nr:hypothetical protein B0H11DRAFT_2061095 [Mycena galericulata]
MVRCVSLLFIPLLFASLCESAPARRPIPRYTPSSPHLCLRRLRLDSVAGGTEFDLMPSSPHVDAPRHAAIPVVHTHRPPSRSREVIWASTANRMCVDLLYAPRSALPAATHARFMPVRTTIFNTRMSRFSRHSIAGAD